MEREKFVDESWKDAVTNEKSTIIGADSFIDNNKSEEEATPEEVSPEGKKEFKGDMIFLNYIISLGYQAMVFMGEVENPATKLIEKNLVQAKFIIDTMGMLREKTKGNLTKDEDALFNGTLYELQVKFVELAQKEVGPQ